MVLPLPTSPETLTMPSSCSTAYASASSVAPRSAPSKKKSVCGVMRNGGSFSPKCSRESATLLVLAGVHAAVKRRAIDPEELRGLADVAAREAQGRLDVATLPRFQCLVQTEAARALELAQRLLGDGAHAAGGRSRRLEVELGLKLRHRQALSGVFGGQANHDVAQLTHVAGEVVLLPARRCRGVELEGLRAGLRGREAPEVLEERELVAL